MLKYGFVFLQVFVIYKVSCTEVFRTQQGCNATLVCYHPQGSAVSWRNSLGQITQGPRFIITDEQYYSTCTVINVTTADQGNITCNRTNSETATFTLEVFQVDCKDEFSSKTCIATIEGGDDCSTEWMKNECKKACGLCPKPNCTITESPTNIPLTTTQNANVTQSANSTSTNAMTSGIAPTTDEPTSPTVLTRKTTTTASPQTRNSHSTNHNRCQDHVVLASLLLIWSILAVML